jgi:hypothetical protein
MLQEELKLQVVAVEVVLHHHQEELELQVAVEVVIR